MTLWAWILPTPLQQPGAYRQRTHQRTLAAASWQAELLFLHMATKAGIP